VPANASSAQESAAAPASRRLQRFAWGVLAYNLLVIAWGAFVRATGSGAGCGAHWPLCNGEVVPRPKSLETVIELSHRVTSGVSVIFVAALYVAARRALPRGHVARRASLGALLFSLGEALIGGVLVLLELVAHEKSVKRAFSSMLHLGNTFFLLAALVLAAWFLRGPAPSRVPSRVAAAPREGVGVLPNAEEGRTLVRVVALVAIGSLFAVGVTGAIAALGDTLFPATSLREGLAQDLSPASHVFLRLRAVHPLLAVASAATVLSSVALFRAVRPAPRVLVLSRVFAAAFLSQVGLGLLNLLLLAPVWMQLVHLLVADLVWISLVLLVWETIWGEGPAFAGARARTASSAAPA
jgi:heme A synthase